MVAIEMPLRRANVQGRDIGKGWFPMLFNSTLPLRFWRKVYADEYGCWLWTANHAINYGQFSLEHRRKVYAHRLAYEDLRGPIARGLVIDHLCRIPPCVNPWHLEPVTERTNILRGNGGPAQIARSLHCRAGHLYTPTNTYTHRQKSGVYRGCKTCYEARQKRKQLKARAKRSECSGQVPETEMHE